VGIGAALLGAAGVAAAEDDSGSTPARAESSTAEPRSTGVAGEATSPTSESEHDIDAGPAPENSSDEITEFAIEADASAKDGTAPEDRDSTTTVGLEQPDPLPPPEQHEPDGTEMDTSEGSSDDIPVVKTALAAAKSRTPVQQPVTPPLQQTVSAPHSFAAPQAAAAPAFPVSANIPVGGYPGYVTASRDGRFLYVTNALDGTVSMVDTKAKTSSTIPVGANPMQPAVSVDGRYVYVAHYQSNSITVIDTKTKTTSSVNIGQYGVERLWMSPDGGTAYVGISGGVVVVDTKTNAVIGDPIRLSFPARDITISPDSTKLFVLYSVVSTQDGYESMPTGGVEVIDAVTGEPIGGIIPVGTTPTALTLSKDGTRLYVGNVLPAATPYGTDLSTPGTVTIIDTNSSSIIKTVPVGIRPVHIVASGDGRWVYVINSARTDALAYPPLGDITTIDTRTNTVVGQRIPVGFVPYGISSGGSDGAMLSTDGRRLFVINVVDATFNPATVGVGTLQVFDTSAGLPRLLGTTPLGINPTDIALSPDGQAVYVTNLYASMPTDPQSLPSGSVMVVPTGITTAPTPAPPKPPAVNRYRGKSSSYNTPMYVATTATAATSGNVASNTPASQPKPPQKPTSFTATLAERVLSTPANTIQYEAMVGADGKTRLIFFIGGTGSELLSQLRNGGVYAGGLFEQFYSFIHKISLQYKTTVGPWPFQWNQYPEIMLVGHSQGGMDAQNIAWASALDPTVNITTVVTFGAPVIKPDSPFHHSVHIQATEDRIADLGLPLSGSVFEASSGYPRPGGTVFNIADWANSPAHRAGYPQLGDQFKASTEQRFNAVKSEMSKFNGYCKTCFDATF